MRSRDTSTLSLDSFFDILTNVAGVMILIALLTILSTGDISVTLGTPVLHDPPRAAKPLHIECRGRELFFVEAQDFLEEFWERVQEHIEGEKLFSGRSDLEAVLASGHFGNEFYRLRSDPDSLYLEPEPGARGLSLRQIGEEQSEFLTRLRSMDPDETYLYFLVRDDSFGTFRRARSLARGLGFSTGWFPLSKDDLLRIGSGGHKVQ